MVKKNNNNNNNNKTQRNRYITKSLAETTDPND